MSIAALLLGVETRLRSAAVLNDLPDEEFGKVCGVQPDGQPPANCGQYYYAIHFEGLRNADLDSLSGDWFYSVGVTITARMGYAPRDRRGKRATVAQEILDKAIEAATALHQDDLHRIEANKVLGMSAAEAAIGRSATVNGFLEPLRLSSIGEMRKAPAGWVGNETERDVYTVALKLVDARRIQLL
jgi:hypothetical protein